MKRAVGRTTMAVWPASSVVAESRGVGPGGEADITVWLASRMGRRGRAATGRRCRSAYLGLGWADGAAGAVRHDDMPDRPLSGLCEMVEAPARIWDRCAIMVDQP